MYSENIGQPCSLGRLKDDRWMNTTMTGGPGVGGHDLGDQEIYSRAEVLQDRLLNRLNCALHAAEAERGKKRDRDCR